MWGRKFLFAALLTLAACLSVSASGQTVGRTVNVTNDSFADNEESAGMSPDGSLLAASWNDFDFNDGCGFSFSTNGGNTWAPRSFVPGFTGFTNDPNIAGTGTFAVAGDPSVTFNPRSQKFVVVCQAFGATGGAINLLSTTFDPVKADPRANENASYVGAQNPWTTPVAITTGISNGTQKGSNGQFPDHESIAVDTRIGSEHFGRVFVVWAEFNGSGRSPIDLAFSDDDGSTWTGPIRVSDAQHKFDQDARAIIGPDGAVYVTFTTGPNETSLKNNFAAIAVSQDGGQTFSPTQLVAAIVNPVPGVLPNSKYRVFSDVTSAVAANNHVTVVWNDERTGHSNVYSTHNLSPGNITQWSPPVAVIASDKEQFFPWMVASPSGDRLDLTFYDRTPDQFDTLNFVRYAKSPDNGVGWTTLIATGGFDGDKFQACLALVQPSNCGDFFLGDYIAVVSTESVVHLLYTFNGQLAQDVFDTQITP
jgi:hypothetical protein